MLNSFYVFSLTWISAVILYLFRYSDLFPKMSFEFLSFIIILILCNLLVGYIFRKRLKLNKNISEIKNNSVDKIPIIILILFILEFMLAGKVPLFEILKKTGYDYNQFRGVKTLHFILVTFSIYYSIYLFSSYLCNRKKINLFFYFLIILCLLLLYNRGGIVNILGASLFIYIDSQKNSIKNFLKYLFLLILFMYFFGVVGNIRVNRSWNNSEVINEMGYKNSNYPKLLPDEFFWSYIYITSPIGNLINTINNYQVSYDLEDYILKNIAPDVISKKFRMKKNIPELLNPTLNVSTMFVESYMSLGLFGMYLIGILSIIFNIFYLFLLKKNSKYYTSGLAILTMISCFSFFANMYVFTGMSIQLVYPIILSIIYEKKYKR